MLPVNRLEQAVHNRVEDMAGTKPVLNIVGIFAVRLRDSNRFIDGS